MSQKKSYAQTRKASSIMGGAAGINLLPGMVRVKFAAVRIGTTGMGLVATHSRFPRLSGWYVRCGAGGRSPQRIICGKLGASFSLNKCHRCAKPQALGKGIAEITFDIGRQLINLHEPALQIIKVQSTNHLGGNDMFRIENVIGRG